MKVITKYRGHCNNIFRRRLCIKEERLFRKTEKTIRRQVKDIGEKEFDSYIANWGKYYNEYKEVFTTKQSLYLHLIENEEESILRTKDDLMVKEKEIISLKLQLKEMESE